jgi:transformation/transcription domain-associated protein
MCKQAVSLLHNLLQPQYWGDLDIDLFPNVTETVLASERTVAALAGKLSADKDNIPDDKFTTTIINTLQVVRIIANITPDDWILKNMATLQHILENCLKSENPEIQDYLNAASKKSDKGRKLKPLLKRILDAVPDDVSIEAADTEGEQKHRPPRSLNSYLQSRPKHSQLAIMSLESTCSGPWHRGSPRR